MKELERGGIIRPYDSAKPFFKDGSVIGPLFFKESQVLL